MNAYENNTQVMAPNAQDFIGGNYLQKEAINEPTTVTVTDVRADDIPGATRRKLVVWFREFDKPLILNKTNIRELSAIFRTTDTAVWRGQEITLYVDPTVEFGGRRVGGIRVQPASIGKTTNGYHGEQYPGRNGQSAFVAQDSEGMGS